MAEAPPVLAELWRGEVIEAELRGILAVVSADGPLVASAGDVERLTYLRSSSKPFQAIALVNAGAAQRFGLTQQEISVVCGSHYGEPIHLETVRSILEKIGLREDVLQCGIHPPMDKSSAEALIRAAGEPRAIHNNCSGKHAGMLALARHLGAPLENYVAADHPVQRRILQVIADMSGVPADRIPLGTDGCGVPTFALPIRRIALMFARLARPEAAPGPLRDACRIVVDAMVSYPEMVSGTRGRWDTELMRAGKGDIVSKGGAEGLSCFGVRSRGLGVALKSTDGGGRGNPAILCDLLRRLEVLSGDALVALAEWAEGKVKSTHGEVVGRLRVVSGELS